jgi:hypothetical protein
MPRDLAGWDERCRPGSPMGVLSMIVALLGVDAGHVASEDAQRIARFRAAQRAFAERLKAGDLAGARAALAEQKELAPGRPDVDYNLACLEARGGRVEAALGALAAAVEAGLAQDFTADPDLTPLRADPRWNQLRAKYEAQRRPVLRGEVEATLPAGIGILEDVALDPHTGALFISSARTGEVFRRRPGGPWERWTHPAAEGMGALALGVDAKRRHLLVTTAAIPPALGYRRELDGRSELVVYGVDDGRELARVSPPADDGPKHLLGDLVVGTNGTAFISDSTAGTVYRLAPDGRALERLVALHTFGSPQTPALSADERLLFVPDYTLGLFVLPVPGSRAMSSTPDTKVSNTSSRANTSSSPIPVATPPELATAGIDGLVAVPGGLVAVQNGIVVKRIIRLWLTPDGRRVSRWEVLARGPLLGEPTHAVRQAASLLGIIDSGWDRFEEDGTPRPGSPAQPRLIRLPLH